MSKTLEQKNTFYLMIWLPIVFLLGSVLFYIILTMHASHMQYELLGIKQQNVRMAFIEQPSGFPLRIPGEYTIDTLLFIGTDRLDKRRDTVLYYPSSQEEVSFKLLTKQYLDHGKKYELTTYISSKEFNHLIVKVFIVELFIFLLIILAILIINRKSSGLIWKPFYQTLRKIGSYDVRDQQVLQLEAAAGIDEFEKLNKVLVDLTNKTSSAYLSQKQFVENASHEIQTPLAIIRSKLDLLINEKGLSEKTAALLFDITEANERLSQLNKSLLLLTKIENRQFEQLENIDISLLVKKILGYYEDYYNDFPKVNLDIMPKVMMPINLTLSEILFTNLIKNAVIHNIPQGFFYIKILPGLFIIENSGEAISDDPELFFERFRKGTTDIKTTGLGLALVKQIIQLYHFNIQYQYKDRIHRISIEF